MEETEAWNASRPQHGKGWAQFSNYSHAALLNHNLNRQGFTEVRALIGLMMLGNP